MIFGSGANRSSGSSSDSSKKTPGDNGSAELQGVPRHLAVIMDGNGRYAKSRGLPRVEGHRQGVGTVRMVVEESRRAGVRYLTLYAFSSENWNRPKTEVAALMGFFERFLGSELPLLMKNGIRLRAIGDLERLPKGVQAALQSGMEKSKDQTGMDLVLAVSYGGRDEIVAACRSIAEQVAKGELLPEAINGELFQRHLYAPEIPDPDLLIRTSDELRVSNFLLWQIAYSEIVVSSKLWPEFSKEDLFDCFREYAKRRRRFGLTDEQIEGSR